MRCEHPRVLGSCEVTDMEKSACSACPITIQCVNAHSVGVCDNCGRIWARMAAVQHGSMHVQLCNAAWKIARWHPPVRFWPTCNGCDVNIRHQAEEMQITVRRWPGDDVDE